MAFLEIDFSDLDVYEKIGGGGLWISLSRKMEKQRQDSCSEEFTDTGTRG